VLQCVAVCCSVLQCVAVCCSGEELQHKALLELVSHVLHTHLYMSHVSHRETCHTHTFIYESCFSKREESSGRAMCCGVCGSVCCSVWQCVQQHLVFLELVSHVSHTYMSHVTHTHLYMSHVSLTHMRHVSQTHMNPVTRTHMSHVSHVNESCPICA